MTNDEDYSAACDDLADIGLTPDQIDDVWRWHRITQRRQMQTAGGIAIVRILSHIFSGHVDGNLAVRVAGLAWGFGLGHLTGHDCAADHAHELGVSRQAIAEAAKAARKALEG
jgi:hypothetical protein